MPCRLTYLEALELDIVNLRGKIRLLLGSNLERQLYNRNECKITPEDHGMIEKLKPYLYKNVYRPALSNEILTIYISKRPSNLPPIKK